jgi:hypothetical protein
MKWLQTRIEFHANSFARTFDILLKEIKTLRIIGSPGALMILSRGTRCLHFLFTN